MICQFSAFGSKTMTLPGQERSDGITVLTPLPDLLGATMSVEVSPAWLIILAERKRRYFVVPVLASARKDGVGCLAANHAFAKEEAVAAQVPNGCPSGGAVEVIGIGIDASKEAQDQIGDQRYS